MNAKEAYNLTLQNLVTLKKEQILEIDAYIEKRVLMGKFNYITTDEIYNETKNDLISRGYKVSSHDSSLYIVISWDPEKPDTNLMGL